MATSSAAQETTLRRFAGRVLRELRQSGARVEVQLLPPAEMVRLEWRYAKKRRREVEVLSFPEVPGFPPGDRSARRLLGQVYLNRHLAADNPVRAKYLLLHGILHLAGYSHARKGDMMKMQQKENQLCQRILSSAWISELRPSKR